MDKMTATVTTAAQAGAERARSRARAAGDRVRQLQNRRRELAIRQRNRRSRVDKVKAVQDAKVIDERAATALKSLRLSRLRSAAAHDSAACVFERVAELGLGRGSTCRAQAAGHRAAAAADRRRAAGCRAPQSTETPPPASRHDALWHRVVHAARRADPSVGCAAAVAQATLRTVPGVDAVVITIRGDGLTQHEVAATCEWGHRAEELQYTTGEGPSVVAFTTGRPSAIPELAGHGWEWPGFVDAALDRGIGAVFSFPLVATVPLGTMTLYCRSAGTPPAGLADAWDLAGIATAVLLADAESELLEQISGAGAHDDINIAVGMLSARDNLTGDQALASLRAKAFTSGRSLALVAREIVSRHLRD
ncbi:ANTAR domain-containing protein [Amycolatopsis sp. OK19-0408]|uniref:ANTAR domain-containing protein n=1 Tax=Amycolatopsis iheyensis TaxID=2945988 RepID=A0A9X2NQS4_9PSEU|nr:ANTAR domain-containing protein [Amycolatopsis iheyensis]MCR6490830.1 ANTAR domain-containing protein [Amycolatopsis iheyensis]